MYGKWVNVTFEVDSRVVIGQGVVAAFQALQVVAEAALRHAKLGHCPSPLHQVEGHHRQGVALSCLGKAEDVKVPVVICVLCKTQSGQNKD